MTVLPDEDELPQWAPRVEKRKIQQLYQNDARGIYDEELIIDQLIHGFHGYI